MRILARSKQEQNRAVLDPWSVVHLGVGLAAGLTKVPLPVAVAGSIVYELLEQVAERRGWGRELFETAGPESLPNAIADTVLFVVGHRLGEWWSSTDGDPTSSSP